MQLRKLIRAPCRMFEQLDRIENKLNQLLTAERKLQMTLDELQAAVEAEDTVIDSAVTLLASLSQMLKDAIASGDPAKVQAIVDLVNTKKQALADAIVANTPAEG